MSLISGWNVPGQRLLLRCALLVVCVLSSLPTSAKAQLASLAFDPTAIAAEPHASTTVGSIVTDSDGDVIAGAQITLARMDGTEAGKTVSDTDGSFRLLDVPAGAFQLTITANGFAARTISATVYSGEQYTLPPIRLAASANLDVEVVFSRHDQAAAEVKAEEKQRLAGFLPNYFVTYNWHAAPLSSKQKFELAWKTTLDPASFIVTGAVAGVQQAQNDFKGYGQGAQGYGKRYGAAFADDAIGNMLGGAILPSLLHQDPRYFYKGTGSFRSRLSYALAAAVICKGDNGRWQPNYSSVLGDLAAGGISNLYYPSSDRSGVGLTFENGLLGIVGDAVGNVIQEFVFRKITPHLPKSNSAKP